MTRRSDIETCGPYHSLNTQFVRSPSQAAISNVSETVLCTLECWPPSPPKLSLCWVCTKLFKTLGNDIFHQRKSTVRGSNIEACGPYHSLDTHFDRSPSQATISNVVWNGPCVRLNVDLRLRRRCNYVGFVSNCSYCSEFSQKLRKWLSKVSRWSIEKEIKRIKMKQSSRRPKLCS